MSCPKLKVRPARDNDWKGILEVEKRWLKESVRPISKNTFLLWLQTNPAGFLVAEDEKDCIVGHSYGECVQFQVNKLNDENLSIFSRPYDEPMHTAAGNALVALNVVGIPGSWGGRTALTSLTNKAKLEGKEWAIFLPRMPGLSAFCQDTRRSRTMGDLSDKDLAASYAVRSMTKVGGKVLPEILNRANLLNLPSPTEPDPVLGKLVGKILGGELCEIIDSGFSDPQSLNLAGLCIKRL
jgi:hypothetical protein